jgi:hypothetical protein
VRDETLIKASDPTTVNERPKTGQGHRLY